MNAEPMRLWQANHPYYCSDTNFRTLDNTGEWASWQEFHEGWGQSDEDMNLVFRWDWKKADPDDYDPDEEVPGDKLYVFIMLQRKGDFWAHIIDITDDDEPAVREWLTGRARTITAIWAPISLAPVEVAA